MNKVAAAAAYAEVRFRMAATTDVDGFAISTALNRTPSTPPESHHEYFSPDTT